MATATTKKNAASSGSGEAESLKRRVEELELYAKENAAWSADVWEWARKVNRQLWPSSRPTPYETVDPPPPPPRWPPSGGPAGDDKRPKRPIG